MINFDTLCATSWHSNDKKKVRYESLVYYETLYDTLTGDALKESLLLIEHNFFY
jgi:hypothetical protein